MSLLETIGKKRGTGIAMVLLLCIAGTISAGSGIAPSGDEAALPERPWPYERLDVEEVRKLGHWGYYEGGCSYGAFYALLTPLQETVGSPYTGIPADMLTFGRGGIVGQGDLCGALLGALAAINLVTGEKYPDLADALLTYYRETPLPTEQANTYAQAREFLVEDPAITANIESTVAGSITCRDSRRTWMRAARQGRHSAERRERCARVTGDVAAHAAALLNEWAETLPDN